MDNTQAAKVADGLVEMLVADNARMRRAGCKLAEAAQFVIGEYDGLHRLSLAVAEWATAIANEGHRAALTKDSEHDRP